MRHELTYGCFALLLVACGEGRSVSEPQGSASTSSVDAAVAKPGASSEHERLLFGKVTDESGRPIEGVMVRLQNTETLLAESVFTDRRGVYRLPTDLSGALSVRTRVPYFSDRELSISFADKTVVEMDIQLTAMASDEEISTSLPSVFHFNQIAFDEDPASVLSRSGFQRDCAGCHQFGNEFTRRDRDQSLWSPTIARMHAYFGNSDTELIARRAAMLDMSGPYGDTVMTRPDFAVDAEVHSAKIYEYPLEDVIFPHDAEISPVDGMSYSVDRLGDTMVVTEFDTGGSTHTPMPPPKRPAEEGANGYTSRSSKPGPHSLALGGGNLWYTTNATSDEIGVFDAASQEWRESYVVPTPGRYPHTVRIDSQNIVWFTLAGSEQ
ncbi:MAG: carboxypeptidase regulatory-like domain-containing protein, partial [Pseudomonadota bacterium]